MRKQEPDPSPLVHLYPNWARKRLVEYVIGATCPDEASDVTAVLRPVAPAASTEDNPPCEP